MKIELFRFRSENGIFKFLDEFNKKKNAKNILTFLTSMIFLINIYSLKITDINNISLPNVISQILSVNLMLSNIYHLVNSELSLSKMDSFREELKLKKNFFSKIWFIFNIYEVGYLPYEIGTFLFLMYLNKGGSTNELKRRENIIFLARNIPFYLILIFKNNKLLNNNNFKDLFEFCHSLLGIIMMCKYRFERFPDYTPEL